MDIDDPKIITLREKVTAAQQEFDLGLSSFSCKFWRCDLKNPY